MPRRNRKMKGGFLDSLSNSLSSGWSSLTQSASNVYNKTKSAVTGTPSSTPSYTPSYTPSSTPSYTPGYTPTQPTYSVGGRTRRNKKGGSYTASKSVSSLAASSSSISNIKTAQPHHMVGGKKTRRNCKQKHKHSRKCKH